MATASARKVKLGEMVGYVEERGKDSIATVLYLAPLVIPDAEGILQPQEGTIVIRVMNVTPNATGQHDRNVTADYGPEKQLNTWHFLD